MDDFKKAQYKEIGIGGYKCKCCSVAACNNSKNKSNGKAELKRRARRRLRFITKQLIMED